MTRGRKLGVCAEQNTLDINVPNLLKCTAANRAGAPRDNIYKDDQTSPQALATVADDERVGRIDHPSPDIVQRSSRGHSSRLDSNRLSSKTHPPSATFAGTYVDDWSHDQDKTNARPQRTTRCYTVKISITRL